MYTIGYHCFMVYTKLCYTSLCNTDLCNFSYTPYANIFCQEKTTKSP